jgi:hypothetical protein
MGIAYATYQYAPAAFSTASIAEDHAAAEFWESLHYHNFTQN